MKLKRYSNFLNENNNEPINGGLLDIDDLTGIDPKNNFEESVKLKYNDNSILADIAYGEPVTIINFEKTGNEVKNILKKLRNKYENLTLQGISLDDWKKK